MTIEFDLGRIVATPRAIQVLARSGQTADFFLQKHVHGDWGEVCESDAELNDQAVVDGSRVLSAYTTLTGVKIWIITEATDDKGRRAATTILLPDEY